MGVTSGSYDQSDDDDIDTEAGPCEQSDQAGVRRIKRSVVFDMCLTIEK